MARGEPKTLFKFLVKLRTTRGQQSANVGAVIRGTSAHVGGQGILTIHDGNACVGAFAAGSWLTLEKIPDGDLHTD